MATDESSFKREFREALEKHYKDAAAVWTNNDMFRCGLPDFNVHWNSMFFPIEAKFVKDLPKNNTSGVLKHKVSSVQLLFMRKILTTGGFPVILIGMPDVAVAVPFDMWPFTSGSFDDSKNISKAKLMYVAERGMRFNKTNDGWDVSNFLEGLIEHVR